MTEPPAKPTANGCPVAFNLRTTWPDLSSTMSTSPTAVRATAKRCVDGSSKMPLTRPPTTTSDRLVSAGPFFELPASYEYRVIAPEYPRVMYRPSRVQVIPDAHGVDSRSTSLASSPTDTTSTAFPSCESTATHAPSGDIASEEAKPSTGIVKPTGVTSRPSGSVPSPAAERGVNASATAATTKSKNGDRRVIMFLSMARFVLNNRPE